MRKLILANAVLLCGATAAVAQSSLGIGAAEQPVAPIDGGLFSSFFAWVAVQQREFYQLMTDALRVMRSDPSAGWVLVGLSFLYGVLHAMGPGHGKVVISSYMLANEEQLRRGVMLSFASSIVQAFSAIVIVALGFLVLRQLSVSVTDTTRAFEIASYAMVTALGAWLLLRKVPGWWAGRKPAALSSAVVADAHHNHHHGHHDHHHHDHGDDGVCSSCGHAHMPSPAQAEAARTSRERMAAVLSVGLRPCTGALVVLTFAFMNGLWVAGIASTFAMALGTAITVSTLASLAVTAKNIALRYSGYGAVSRTVTSAIEVAGAVFILLVGLTMLGGALAI